MYLNNPWTRFSIPFKRLNAGLNENVSSTTLTMNECMVIKICHFIVNGSFPCFPWWRESFLLHERKNNWNFSLELIWYTSAVANVHSNGDERARVNSICKDFRGNYANFTGVKWQPKAHTFQMIWKETLSRLHLKGFCERQNNAYGGRDEQSFEDVTRLFLANIFLHVFIVRTFASSSNFFLTSKLQTVFNRCIFLLKEARLLCAICFWAFTCFEKQQTLLNFNYSCYLSWVGNISHALDTDWTFR